MLYRIGIIALEEERIAKSSFFSFRRRKTIERFLAEKDLEISAVYVSKKLKVPYKLLLQSNLSVAVCTKQFIKKFGQINLSGIEIINGISLYKKMIPKIINKIIKLMHKDKHSCTIAIDDQNKILALSLAKELCSSYRFIKIISKDKTSCCDIADKIISEFGVPIIISDAASRVQCDLVIKTGVQMPNVPNHTIVIDACTEHTITRKNTVDWVGIKTNFAVPYELDSLSLAQAVWRVTGKEPELKINKFYCGENKTVLQNSKTIDNMHNIVYNYTKI